MKTTDKIAKEVLGLFEYSKDVVDETLNNENSRGRLNFLTEEQLTVVRDLVTNSISQAYQRSYSSFHKNVENLISNATRKEDEEQGSFFSRKRK
jgi:hypothetical protein